MIAGLILAAALAAAPATAAKARPAEDTGEICLTFALVWSGSNEDVRHIAAIPVPDSYRRHFTVDGCNQLVRESLIDWHLSFGTEATTTAALAFLESAYLAGTVAPERFPAAFAESWKAADLDSPTIRAIALLRADRRAAAIRRFSARPAVGRLRDRLEMLDHYVLLAEQYLRAAEFYRSRVLLDHAERYAVAAGAAAAVLATVSRFDEPHRDAVTEIGLDLDRTDALDPLRMHHAVAAAFVTGEPARIAAARSVMDGYDRPIFDVIGGNVHGTRDPVCTGEAAGDAASEIAKACASEDNLDRAVLPYFRNRAYLDIAQAGAKDCGALGERDFAGFNAAIRLIENARADEDAVNEWPRYHDDELFALHMARASLALRSAGDPSTYCGAHVARDEARKALASTSAPRSPRRFRAAAVLFLAADAALRKAAGADPAGDRQAAFLRSTLRDLDRIAVGDAGAD